MATVLMPIPCSDFDPTETGVPWSLLQSLGHCYRTYPKPVETGVGEALARPEDFIQGPTSIRRDSPANLEAGFTVLDGNYLSARWPGDAHRFAAELAKLL